MKKSLIFILAACAIFFVSCGSSKTGYGSKKWSKTGCGCSSGMVGY